MQNLYEIPNNFSVIIVADGVKTINRNGGRYIALANDTEYKIRLENSTNMRADATVFVDGEKAGTWRLGPTSTTIIERPANSSRKFTFVGETSRIARIAGVERGLDDNGLIKVIFSPERSRLVNWCAPLVYSNDEETITSNRLCRNSNSLFSNNNLSLSNQSLDYSSGATVLGGESSQEFRSVSPLIDINRKMIKTIMLRLVVDNTRYSPYITMKEENRRRIDDYPLRIEDIEEIPMQGNTISLHRFPP